MAGITDPSWYTSQVNKNFYHVLANSLIVMITTNFVWFALIYWLYLGTGSVFATSIMTGVFLVATSASSIWFGSIVDHNKKKNVMLLSSLATLGMFLLAFLVYLTTPEHNFSNLTNVPIWAIVFAVLGGVIAGNLRNIAVPTVTTLLIPKDQLDKANGMIGTVMGISFAVASVASGFILGFSGMYWVLFSGVILTALGILHLWFVPIPEKKIVASLNADGSKQNVDLRGTIAAIRSIPGLFPLIFFTTFNNFLGGVFMPLMDPYGLSLVSLQVWGTLWGVLSMGFILGGLYIAKYGLGENPLRRLFLVNLIMWVVCIFFAIQPSIVLLSIGMLIWVCLVPFVEATEHTIIQKVVPAERLGRVFGFAQSIESAASPLTAFFIGPITQFIFIPFMTTGRGVELIGDWFGVGPGRGIALVFICAGWIGLIVTLIAMRSRSYKLLSKIYAK